MEKVLTNQDVHALVQGGLLLCSTHTLAPEHAYKVAKLRRSLKNVWESISDKDKELLTEAGINDDEIEWDEKHIFGKIKDLNKAQRYMELKQAFMNDSAGISVVKIPYSEYHKLAAENAKKGAQESDIFNPMVEDILEGILFDYPED